MLIWTARPGLCLRCLGTGSSPEPLFNLMSSFNNRENWMIVCMGPGLRIMCKRVLVVVIGVLLWCAAAEGGLRLLNVRFDASLFTPDPELGWALRPNAKGWNVSEGEAYVRINSVGMRDKERSVQKPPNTFRIAFLGDSMTEARQVALKDTYCARLEEKLQASAMKGRTVEVLNFGVPGYGTAQELLMLRNMVQQYKPDLVLLEFYFGNDLADNHRALDYTKAGGRPYFVEKDGQLILDDFFRYRPELQPTAIHRHNQLADLMNHSRLLLLLESAKAKLRTIGKRQVPKADPVIPSDYVRTLMYIPPRISYAIETWKVTEGMLLMLRDEARSEGAGFLLLDFPMGMQISTDQQKQR